MGAIQIMGNAADGIKKPVIFINSLSKDELKKLAKKAGKHEQVFSLISTHTVSSQIFTYANGDLGIAESFVVNKYEVLCTSYDEFIPKWEQYKLWLTLQSIQ